VLTLKSAQLTQFYELRLQTYQKVQVDRRKTCFSKKTLQKLEKNCPTPSHPRRLHLRPMPPPHDGGYLRPLLGRSCTHDRGLWNSVRRFLM